MPEDYTVPSHSPFNYDPTPAVEEIVEPTVELPIEPAIVE